jgi:flavin reductase (DIM6/NTAB) family NADH-FMN oxidoreductase RutF
VSFEEVVGPAGRAQATRRACVRFFVYAALTQQHHPTHHHQNHSEFVVNIISEWYVEAANHTCGDFPPATDEAAAAGLSPLPSTVVRAPRLAEAAVSLECVLRATHPTRDPKTGKDTGAVVLAEVVRFHVAEAVAGRSPTGKLVVDAAALAPVSRLGGVTYGRTSELYDLPRPGSDGRYAGGRRGPVASG